MTTQRASRPITDRDLENLSGPSFTLPCKLTITPPDFTKSDLFDFEAFRKWFPKLKASLHLQTNPKHRYHSNPFQLKEIEVKTWVQFGSGKPGFVLLEVRVENEDSHEKKSDGTPVTPKTRLPGTVFLRGQAVACLIILHLKDIPASSEDGKFVILTVQPRLAAGSLAFTELPAGMVDSETHQARPKMLAEIREEVGMEINPDYMQDLSQMAFESSETSASTSEGGNDLANEIRDAQAQKETEDAALAGEEIEQAMFPSVGACDESIRFFLYEARVERSVLERYHGKLTGNVEEGESIKLRIIPLRDLWKVGARDGKVLSALALYERAAREGRLREVVDHTEKE